MAICYNLHPRKSHQILLLGYSDSYKSLNSDIHYRLVNSRDTHIPIHIHELFRSFSNSYSDF